MGITQGNDHAPLSPEENSEALHALNTLRASRCGTSARSCIESKLLFFTLPSASSAPLREIFFRFTEAARSAYP
jgi:hypothetical protein